MHENALEIELKTPVPGAWLLVSGGALISAEDAFSSAHLAISPLAGLTPLLLPEAFIITEFSLLDTCLADSRD